MLNFLQKPLRLLQLNAGNNTAGLPACASSCGPAVLSSHLCCLLTLPLPLLLLLLLLLLLGLLCLQVVQKVEYPIWVVYVTQAFMFGGGLAGISYGILSTSWDPRREGSALGWTELQVRYWPEGRAGLQSWAEMCVEALCDD
jgi:hypothetical protein